MENWRDFHRAIIMQGYFDQCVCKGILINVHMVCMAVHIMCNNKPLKSLMHNNSSDMEVAM